MIGRRYHSSRTFEDWVRKAKPGERLVYFRGDLANARVGRSREAQMTNAVAKTALLYTGQDLPVISPCYHIRGWVRGPKSVSLVQEKDGSGGRVYVAVKR